MKMAGIDTDSCTWVNITSIPSAILAVINGQVDACFVFEGARYVFANAVLDESGNPYDLYSLLSVAKLSDGDIPNDAIAVNTRLSDNDAEAVKEAFLKMAADEKGLEIMSTWNHSGYVEANEADSPGANYFVKKRIDQLMRRDPLIDTIILGCTHYPLLMNSIVRNVPDGVRVMPQGTYVADSLNSYLQRHPDIEANITRGGKCHYLTTESEDRFAESAQIFLHEKINVTHVEL